MIESQEPGNRLGGGHWWLVRGLVLAVVLAATVPTAGDLGLTWDEPAYRYSQVMSAQWWERLGQARSWSERKVLLDPQTLLFYWPYGRHGINFHPPLAGQLNLATHALFGSWMKDIPSRRLASIFEFAVTIAIGFEFLARRYGFWVGGVMAGSLLLMPRVYGDAHIAGTDIPGLLLWSATALAFWKGLHEPRARRWRVTVGVLVGLAFVEKMGAVMVVGPLLLWLVAARLPRTLARPGGRADWIDGLVTSTLMLAPLAIAFREILRLKRQMPAPAYTNLFVVHPQTSLPGAVLAVPLAVWVVRRFLAWAFPKQPVFGPERPALETWLAILAFGPVVAWLGNPAWWRDTLPRLAHYYMLNTDRQGSLPDIQIIYFGRIYIYSLPWQNAWVLVAITVPAGILGAALAGVIGTLRHPRRDPLRLYFLVHLMTLPVLRMLPTPAHDGVRLLLPTFFFLAAMAGWGLVAVADRLARLFRTRPSWMRAGISALVLGPAAGQLAAIHPYELSYYNEMIGGPRNAWNSGFELTYWYDAFNGPVLAEINRKLPHGATVDFLNPLTRPSTFEELQSLGHLRGDLVMGSRSPDQFPYVWLLTQDSKASPFTRLLFAMRPWYASTPRQLDGLRVVTVADPVAVSRAWALFLLASAPSGKPEAAQPPAWIRRHAPWLGRFWGAGVPRAPIPRADEELLAWADRDPDTLRAAARTIAGRRPIKDGGDAGRLLHVLTRFNQPDKPGESQGGDLSGRLLQTRPEALIEAVEMVIARPDAVRAVLTKPGYTDPATIGGYLDRGLGDAVTSARSTSPSVRPSRSVPPTRRTATTASPSATAAMAAASQ